MLEKTINLNLEELMMKKMIMTLCMFICAFTLVACSGQQINEPLTLGCLLYTSPPISPRPIKPMVFICSGILSHEKYIHILKDKEKKVKYCREK